MKVGFCRISKMPWKPTRWQDVGRGGANVELEAGAWILQAGRRKGDSAVHLALVPAVVVAGGTVEVALPGKFPKKPLKPGTENGTYVLTFPQ
jgi:hypothetical protein